MQCITLVLAAVCYFVWSASTINGPPQHIQTSQMQTPVMPVRGQTWSTSETPAATLSTPGNTDAYSSNWQEHAAAADGKKYYYNKKTKKSCWEKPPELMTPAEACPNICYNFCYLVFINH